MQIPSPATDKQPIVVIGSDYITREIIIHLQRLGEKCIVFSSYPNSPAGTVSEAEISIDIKNRNDMSSLLRQISPDTILVTEDCNPIEILDEEHQKLLCPSSTIALERAKIFSHDRDMKNANNISPSIKNSISHKLLVATIISQGKYIICPPIQYAKEKRRITYALHPSHISAETLQEIHASIENLSLNNFIGIFLNITFIIDIQGNIFLDNISRHINPISYITMHSQNISHFELFARVVLDLPLVTPKIHTAYTLKALYNAIDLKQELNLLAGGHMHIFRESPWIQSDIKGILCSPY